MSGKRNLAFFQPPGGVGQGLVDIFSFKVRVGAQDFLG